MAIYYIDPMIGSNQNDGLSEEFPLKSNENLIPKPGDSVLYKRGSFIRGWLNNRSGEEGKPILYGAYGEGELPVFCGSLDLKDESLWTEESENIWYTDALGTDEAGNFIFDNGECGILKWEKEDLCQQGDFYDDNFGCRNQGILVPHRLYFYSKGNPAHFYHQLEVAVCGHRTLANNGHDMIFENLRFIRIASHGISGDKPSRNITVKNCEFEYIGGMVWSKERQIRFGNAIETWDVGENISVKGCRFCEIYDSAVTHQGSKHCEPGKNLDFSDNVFIKCGMGAFELRDRMPIHSKFNNNICIDAGLGFSHQGIELPRNSEIWPQPMGHHIFMWRVEQPTEGGNLEIKNNIFCNAPHGAAIYSIISVEAEAQAQIEGNIYYTDNTELLTRLHGKNYKNFEEYEEKDAVYHDRKVLKL